VASRAPNELCARPCERRKTELPDGAAHAMKNGRQFLFY